MVAKMIVRLLGTCFEANLLRIVRRFRAKNQVSGKIRQCAMLLTLKILRTNGQIP